MSPQKYKVCHITSLTQMGGVEKMLLDFLTSVGSESKLNFDHVVASTSGSSSIVRQFTTAGIEVFIPKRKFRFDPLAVLYLAKWLKKSNVKIIHTYNNVSNTWGLLAALIAGVDIKISSEHGTAWDTKGWRFFLEKKLLKQADINLANSNASKEILKSKYKIDNNKIFVIHNGIAFKDANSGDKLSRDDFGIKEGDFLIGTVGRIDFPKYQKLIIDVAAQSKSKNLSYKYMIVGDGPLFSELKRYASNLKVDDLVIFTGWRNDARSIISLFDVYLSTSYRESFGNSLAEAAYKKVPVIAPKIDGIIDIFEDEKEALLVEPTILPEEVNIPKHELPDFSFREGKLQEVKVLSSEVIIPLLQQLKGNKKLKTNLVEDAYKKVSTKFSIQSYIKRLNSIYLNSMNK